MRSSSSLLLSSLLSTLHLVTPMNDISNDQCCSESVSSATVAGQDATLSTFEDESWECIVTFFTLVLASHKTPAFVLTVVSLSKKIRSCFNVGSSNWPIRAASLDSVTIDKVYSTTDEAIHLPLGAVALFPLDPANIAELGTTRTAW